MLVIIVVIVTAWAGLEDEDRVGAHQLQSSIQSCIYIM